MQYFHNDTWHFGTEPLLPASDLGVARGFAVFDYLRTYNKKPFCHEMHIQRFFQSASLASLEVPCSKETIEKAIGVLVGMHVEDIGIKILLTAGPSSAFSRVKGNEQLYIFAQKIALIPPEKKQEGVGVKILAFERPYSLIKSTFYFPAVRALDAPFEEILYRDRNGYITEGATSNFFLVKENRLITAKDDIIQGITKEVLINHLAYDLMIEERTVTIEDMMDANEAFITSTSKEILPLAWIEGYRTFSHDRPVTNRLIERFSHYVRGKICVG